MGRHCADKVIPAAKTTMSDSGTTLNEAFVLAAGLGLRMRPITETIPKPLVQVAGKAMLDHALDALEQCGTKNAVVNVHYLADQIEDHVTAREGLRVTISNERAELLDSGGGVKNGIDHFSRDDMFILNSDSFWIDGARPNLTRMREAWDPHRMDMLLLLAPMTQAVGFEGRGDFFMDSEGLLTRRGEAETAPFVYSGAIAARTDLFKQVSEKKFSLNRLFDEAIEKDRLFGIRLEGLWLHVGTPEAIGEAEQAIAQQAACCHVTESNRMWHPYHRVRHFFPRWSMRFSTAN